jgi:hypothetical protein
VTHEMFGFEVMLLSSFDKATATSHVLNRSADRQRPCDGKGFTDTKPGATASSYAPPTEELEGVEPPPAKSVKTVL